jgi:hypothetical protein
MQADTQRQSTRVPLGVLVELTHEDFDESFQADGVDLGVGGLGMRAAFLPDVGSRMRASFDAPDDGRRVEAPCEVVWAKDSGPHVGQVGLRFTSLDPKARQAIEGMITRATDAEAPGPVRKHVVEPEVEELGSDEHTAVRLFIDGVDSSIPARVLARYAGGVRVVQRLGLFQLGTRVDVQNGSRRCSRIEGVAIRTDRGVPELILDLALDATPPALEGGPAAARAPNATALDAEADALVGDGAPDTLPDPPSEPPAQAVASADVADPPPVADTPTPVMHVIRARPPQAPVVAPSFPDRPRAVPAVDEGDRPSRWDALRDAVRRAEPQVRRMRAVLARVLAGIVPLLSRLRLGARALVARVRPSIARMWSRVASRSGHFVAVLRTRLGSRVPLLGARPKKRRTTAPPPTRSNVTRSRKAPAAAGVGRERARTLMLSLVAFAGAAGLVYALSPGSTDEVETHRDVEALESATSGASSGAPATEDRSTDAPEAEEGSTARAEPAAAAPQAPGTVPASSPYADPSGGEEAADGPDAQEAAPELTRAFGAASVPGGRSFLLRMSQPVESLRGVAEANGFTVIVPDSLSLDRAGPIAAAHPAVERSLVLNRGDHAELSIKFVEGRTPSYRVTGRGRAIEITLANE